MTFVEDIEQKCEQIQRELPGDFKRQDMMEGTNNAQEYQFLAEVMRE